MTEKVLTDKFIADVKFAVPERLRGKLSKQAIRLTDVELLSIAEDGEVITETSARKESAQLPVSVIAPAPDKYKELIIEHNEQCLRICEMQCSGVTRKCSNCAKEWLIELDD